MHNHVDNNTDLCIKMKVMVCQRDMEQAHLESTDITATPLIHSWTREDVVYISDLLKVHGLWKEFTPWNGSVINGIFTALTSRLSEPFISL